jgi:uncharacterized protein
MMPQPPPDLPQQNGIVPTAEDRNLAMYCHLSALLGAFLGGGFLGFLGPLIIMNLQQGKSPFVAFHARESINHQITFIIIYVVCFLCLFFGSLFCIGFFFIIPLMIAAVVSLIFEILACLQASRGEWTRIPLSIRFVS